MLSKGGENEEIIIHQLVADDKFKALDHRILVLKHN